MFSRGAKLTLLAVAILAIAIVAGSVTTTLADTPQLAVPPSASSPAEANVLTTKTLNVAYTLVNMGTTTATVAVAYYKPDGGAWTADAGNTSFTIGPNGGQKVIRLYNDATLTAGRGSAVISSDQPLAAVVQILARSPQVPSQSAYAGFAQIGGTYYAPLLMRQVTNAAGQTVNSQIGAQNAGTSATNVSFNFLGAAGTYSKTVTVQPGATYYYDMDGETNLPVGWNGSAVISASGGGQLAVAVNVYTGADTLQTYNAFPAQSVGSSWLVPLFSSRLGNGQSTTLSVQNLSGGTLAAGAISLNCNPDPACIGCSAFSKSNGAAVDNNKSVVFNPVTDMTFPNAWYGSCSISSSGGGVVAFVQIRRIGTQLGAAYEAISGTSTDKKVIFPLASKRLANGQATVLLVQNISLTSAASVNLTFTPSAEYVTAGGSATPILLSKSIPGGSSLIANMRSDPLTIGGTAVTMPNGWYGSLTVTSSDQPIHGMVQVTNYLTTDGDTNQAHLGFTQP